MLILDGHASYITTNAIKFAIAHKIVLLCCPPYTTHILQPLDVGVFAPLSLKYSRGIQDRFRFAAQSVDKVDFLEVYQNACETSISTETILKAWRDCGLNPFSPEVVI